MVKPGIREGITKLTDTGITLKRKMSMDTSLAYPDDLHVDSCG